MDNGSLLCKLIVVPPQRVHLEKTMDAFGRAYAYLWQYGRETGIIRQWDMHQACYQTVRKVFGLPANLAVRVIARAATDLKKYPARHALLHEVMFDSRTFLLHQEDWSVGLTLLQGREKFHLDIGSYHERSLKGRRVCSAVLLRRYKSYYLAIALSTCPGG